ncbi:MAG: RrF2 family transcriptional regulator [Pseudomonadota bacterium]|jgi:Rrf2 family iron-sulfur cluster assembly transcriptional regulator|nr:Rrf2 family transcriptional regulator [Alphaproteobacteria bacterium]
MKLSTKSRYAIMAMVDLAEQPSGSCVSLSSIAERQGLPLQYLEQLFAKLRKSHLVNSSRGTNGGYELTRAPNEIRIYDIILATDAPVKVTRCNAHDAKGCSKDIKRCNSHNLWHELEHVVHDYLIQVSLADVANGNHNHPIVVLNRPKVESIAAR